MEKAWEIAFYPFSIVWVLCTIRFLSPGILHHMVNAWVSPSISHSTGKSEKTHRMGENLGNWYSYFFHSTGPFFPLDSHPMVCFITWEIHEFPQQFPIALENAAKPIELGKPGKLLPILCYPIANHFVSQSMDIFLPSDSHPMVMFITLEMHGFSHQFLIARENAVKSTQVGFIQYYLFYLFQNLVIHSMNKQKKPIK